MRDEELKAFRQDWFTTSHLPKPRRNDSQKGNLWLCVCTGAEQTDNLICIDIFSAHIVAENEEGLMYFTLQKMIVAFNDDNDISNIEFRNTNNLGKLYETQKAFEESRIKIRVPFIIIDTLKVKQ